MKKDIDRVDLMLDYLRGDLTAEQRRRAEGIIGGDPESAGLFATVESLFTEGQKSDWRPLRDSTLKLAGRLFDDYQKSRKRTKIKRGITIFDSMMLPLPAGVRPATVDTRRLKYKVGEMDLELSLYPVTTDSYELIGRVYELESDGGLSVRLKSRRHEFKEEADRFNLFRFVRVPISNYALDLILHTKKIGTVALEL